MHFAVRARKLMNVYPKVPRTVKVNLQFYFKMQALAKIKKIIKAANCQILECMVID